jgi:DNA (cytosine-5)-methyltransferase 1
MIRLGTVFSGIGAIEQAFKRLSIDHELVFACDNGDMDLVLLDKNEQKEYKELQTKRGKKNLTEEDELKLISYTRKEEELAERTRSYIYEMEDKNSKMEYVERLYAKSGKKINHVRKTYLANYPNVADFHIDIRFLDGRDYNEKIDLLVGGSPCQAFSTVGAQAGLNDTRGTLFYEFARIIEETKPKAFIFENVKGLTTHDSGRTWSMIKHIFTDVLHYRITEPQLLNASDFGIPQTRRRVFVIGIREDIKCDNFCYPSAIGCKYTMQDFLEENCACGNFVYDKDGNIRITKSSGDKSHIDQFILTPKVRDYVLSSGTKNFKTSTKTDMPIARTLLKSMTQHHRAGVDNYVTVGVDTEGKKILRALTDRECLRLMGYSDDFKMVVSPMQIYRQAGNSIVVDVMMAIVRELIKTGVFNN